MDIYEKTKNKYTKRKRISIIAMTAGSICVLLTILFAFIDLAERAPYWNQYHFWAMGLGLVLITNGAILFVSSISALKDIEKTVNRLNPDEREQAILSYAKSKTFTIYTLIITPIIFVTTSILLMLDIINFVAWIIFIANVMAFLITYGLVRKNAYKKF